MYMNCALFIFTVQEGLFGDVQPAAPPGGKEATAARSDNGQKATSAGVALFEGDAW